MSELSYYDLIVGKAEAGAVISPEKCACPLLACLPVCPPVFGKCLQAATALLDPTTRSHHHRQNPFQVSSHLGDFPPFLLLAPSPANPIHPLAYLGQQGSDFMHGTFKR